MAFGVKVKLDVEVVGGSKLRSQIQQSIENATQGKPIKIRHLSIDLGRQEARRISKQVESAIASQDISIKIARIDASKPVADLKKQLTTMLSGLSITGLKDFLGADGVADSYEKATMAANKLAEAQDNVRKKTEETNAALITLKTIQSTLKNVLKSTTDVGDQSKREEYLDTYRKLLAASEAAKNMQGDAQAKEVISITTTTIALKQQVKAQLEAEMATKRQAAAAKTKEENERKAAAAQERAAKKEANLSTQAVQLRRRINEWIQNNSKAYVANKTEIDSLLALIQNEGAVTDVALAQIRKRFEEINASVRISGIAGKSFFDTLKAGWEKFGGWSLVTKSMMAAINTVKRMVGAVVSLDSAMTELKKVTNLTSQAYVDFSNKEAQVAKRVGASVADTINATADFARLGYSIEEAASLAEAALVYKNVGDGIDDINIATESLISTLKAFDEIDPSDAMRIVDMFNEVGNNFAISSSGIGDALQRSAAALSAAGNTLEESIGLITAMNSVVQNPETVGTSLKTLTMYLRAAKTEAEEAGIETDDMANSVSELRDEIKGLTGIDIMIDDETFKSTYQIIEEISRVWDSLTDVNRSNVLNLIGGKRNANVVSSLITNFKDAKEAMESATKSLGSATAENEKYLDSIKGKIAILKASFEELSGSVINSGIVKAVLDIANGFMSVVTWLSKVNLLLPGITASIITIRGISNGIKVLDAAKGVASIFSQASSMNKVDEASSLATGAVKAALEGLTNAQRELAAQQIKSAINSSDMSKALKEQATAALTAALSTKSLAGAGKSMSTVMKGVGAAFKSWQGWLLAIEIVIGLVSFAVDKYNQKIQESIEKAHELSDAYSEARDSYTSNTATLHSLEEEFNRLSAGVDANGNNISLTSNEYGRYLSIIDQIVDISPGIVAGYDDQGRAILNYKNALTEAIAEQKTYIENQRRIYISSGKDIFEGTANEYKQWQKELSKQGEKIGDAVNGKWWDASDMQKKLSAWAGALHELKIDISPNKLWREDYDRLIGIYKDADKFNVLLRNSGAYTEEELTNIKTAIMGVAGAYTQLSSIEAEQVNYLMESSKDQDWYGNIPVGAIDEFRAGLVGVNDPLKTYNQNIQAAVDYGQLFANAFATDAAQNLTSMAEDLADGSVKIDDYDKAVSELGAELESLGMSAVADMVVAYFKSLGEYAQEGTDATNNYKASVSGLSDALSALTKGYDILNKAKEEMANGGGLSVDTISSIASMLDEGEKITDYLTYENGLIKLNEQAWKTRSASMVSSNMSALEKQIADLEAENMALSKIPEDAAANSNKIEQNTEKIAALNKELELYRAIYGEVADPTNLTNMTSALDGVSSKIKGLQSVLKGLEGDTALSAEEMANLAFQYEELFGMAPEEYDLSTLEGQKAAIQAIIDAYKAECDAIIQTQITELEAARTREGITAEEIGSIDVMLKRLNALKGLDWVNVFGTNEADDVANKYDKLSDSVNKFTSASKMLADMKSGKDYMSTFQEIADFLAKNKGFSFTDFINNDGSFKNVDEELMSKVFDTMLAEVEKLDGYKPEFGEKWRSEFMKAVNGAEKASEAFETMSKALSGIESAGDMLAGMKSGNDYMDTVQKIMDFLGTYEGFSFNDFFDADGAIKSPDDTLINKIFDVLIKDASQLEGWNPKYGEKWREQFELIISGASDSSTALEKLSDKIGTFSDAANLMFSMKSGEENYIDMLQSIVNFVNDNHGFSLTDFINPDGSLKEVTDELTKDVVDQLLTAMSGMTGYTEAMGDMLLAEYNKIIKGEQEVISSSERVSNALSSVENAGDFFQKISSKDSTVIEQINSAIDLADSLKDAEGNIPDWTSWIKSVSDGGAEIEWTNDAIRALSDAQVDNAFATTGLAEKYPELIQQIKNYNHENNLAAASAERMADSHEHVSSALSAQKDYSGYTQITLDAYQELIEADQRYAAAIEYQNGVYVLNGQKHAQVTQTILSETKALVEAEKQAILTSDEYQKLAKALELGQLDKNGMQRLLDLNVQIQGYDTLANEIDNASSAYARWVNRRGDDGMDRYSQAMEAFELLNATLSDQESEYFGRIGREEFTQAVDFVIGENVELNTPEFERGVALAQRYLTEGAEGAINFYDDLVSNGLLDATTGAMDTTIAEISTKLGVSEELVRTMIDRVNEYQDESAKIKVKEPEVSKSGEAESQIAQLIKSLEDAQTYATTLSETPIDIQITDGENKKELLNSMSTALNTIKSCIQSIIASPLSFNVDDLSLAVETVKGYITKIQEALGETDGLSIDVNTNDSEDKLSVLQGNAQLVKEAFDGIVATLQAVMSGVNILNSNELEINPGRTPQLLGEVSSQLSGIIAKLQQIAKNSKITVRINEVTTSSKSSSSGSAISKLGSWLGNLFGRANAGGTMKSPGGKTLVGELGMETVVDPHTNQWYTVGERGAEFVTLPKDAIVFNHKQTEELFGTGRIDSRGDAMASGNAAVSLLSGLVSGAKNFVSKVLNKTTTAIQQAAGVVASTAVGEAVSALAKPLSDNVSGMGTNMSGATTSHQSSSSGGGGSGGGDKESLEEEESILEKLKKKYEELDEAIQHLIRHQEFLYFQAEKGLNYTGMEDSLTEQARLYREIMANASEAVKEMIANGASDTDKELQEMEEKYWQAYETLHGILDQINTMYVDALNDKIDKIQGAYDNLSKAAEEFSKSGGITVDSFQALIANGVQYLSFLDNVNGQYVINEEAIQKMIAAEKEQLAIEQALSYIKQLQQALTDGDINLVEHLVDLNNQLSDSTWSVVYAQAAMLKAAGLTDEQYQQVIDNINALQALSNQVTTQKIDDIEDTSDKLDDAAKKEEELNKDRQDALDKILDLTEDLIKQETEDQIDAIEGQIDAYKKLIDLKKESLQKSKEENEYAKSVADKTKNIAELQAKIAQLSLDDSREAQAQRAALMEDLADAQADLADAQSDHSYDLQTDALDKMSDEYEQSRQQEIEALENSISSTEKLYQLAIERISTRWDTLYDDLIAWNYESGSTLQSEIVAAWEQAQEAVLKYGSYVQAVAKLKAELEDDNPDDDETPDEIPSHPTVVATGTPSTPTPTPTNPSKPPANPVLPAAPSTNALQAEVVEQPVQAVEVSNGRWHVRADASAKSASLGVVGNGTKLEYTGQEAGEWYSVIYNGQQAWINKGCGGLKKYHTGGIVGGKEESSDKEVMALLEKGEAVLDKPKKEALYEIVDFQDVLMEKLGSFIGNIQKPFMQFSPRNATPALAGVSQGNGGVVFNPNINVNISHNGAMSDKDANQYGKQIAKTALDTMYDSFIRRGISNISSRKLKQ